MDIFHWIRRILLFLVCLLPSWVSYVGSRNDSPYWFMGILCSAILIGIFFPYKVWRKALLFTLILPVLLLMIPSTDGAVEEGRQFFIALAPLTFPLMYIATAIYIFPGAFAGVLLRLLLIDPTYNHFFHKER